MPVVLILMGPVVPAGLVTAKLVNAVVPTTPEKLVAPPVATTKECPPSNVEPKATLPLLKLVNVIVALAPPKITAPA